MLLRSLFLVVLLYLIRVFCVYDKKPAKAKSLPNSAAKTATAVNVAVVDAIGVAEPTIAIKGEGGERETVTGVSQQSRTGAGFASGLRSGFFRDPNLRKQQLKAARINSKISNSSTKARRSDSFMTSFSCSDAHDEDPAGVEDVVLDTEASPSSSSVPRKQRTIEDDLIDAGYNKLPSRCHAKFQRFRPCPYESGARPLRQVITLPSDYKMRRGLVKKEKGTENVRGIISKNERRYEAWAAENKRNMEIAGGKTGTGHTHSKCEMEL